MPDRGTFNRRRREEGVAVVPVPHKPNTQPPHMLDTGAPVAEHVGAMAVAVRQDRLLGLTVSWSGTHLCLVAGERRTDVEHEPVFVVHLA